MLYAAHGPAGGRVCTYSTLLKPGLKYPRFKSIEFFNVFGACFGGVQFELSFFYHAFLWNAKSGFFFCYQPAVPLGTKTNTIFRPIRGVWLVEIKKMALTVPSERLVLYDD